MTSLELLRQEAIKLGIVLTNNQLDAFEAYTKALLAGNEIMNLTTITDPDSIVIKHYLDSLSLLTLPCFLKGASVIDIGTGAGFPGVPLKIARSDLRITLLDTLRKRVDFLEEACSAVGLKVIRREQRDQSSLSSLKNEEPSVTLIWARAEETARGLPFREFFDIAVSRAVAELPLLLEYCLPFVKPGGFFIAMKGPDPSSEIDSSKQALSVLGARIERIENIALQSEIKHTLVCIKKISQTSSKYPRNPLKISKNPL